MSIADVIEKHRKRLSLHRQFLAGGEKQGDEPGNDALAASPPSAATRRVLVTYQSPNDGDASNPRQARSSSGSDPCRRNEALQDRQRNTTHERQLQFGGSEERFTDPEDFLIDARLSTLGKYFTKDQPDQMYKRGLGWLQTKQRRVEETTEEIQKQRLAECTFVPNRAAGGERSKTPTLGGQHQHSAGRRSSGGISATAELDERHFLERQEEARKQRAEAAKKARGADGTAWKPKTTVPIAFDFSKKMVQIPALRKPVLLRQSLQGEDASPPKESTAGRSVQPSFGDDRGEEPQTSRGRTTPMTPPTLLESSVRNNSSTNSLGSPLRGGNSTRRGSRAPQADEIAQVREELARLVKSTEEKDREISSLKGHMSSLQRELEVAKATVRKITLSSS